MVTISLVTYNGAQWLDGCLASLATQDLGDYELLVLDNASDDDAVVRLREYATRAQDGAPRFGFEPGICRRTQSEHPGRTW